MTFILLFGYTIKSRENVKYIYKEITLVNLMIFKKVIIIIGTDSDVLYTVVSGCVNITYYTWSI